MTKNKENESIVATASYCPTYQQCKKLRDCCSNNSKCLGCALPDLYVEVGSCKVCSTITA
ncbi:hypothetical protein ACQJ0K_28580 [Priestia megaterium]|uniref:hypothetical protein n=1 Tax=Priestia megaterium TaxID=1404 RepID=UPI003CF8E5D9